MHAFQPANKYARWTPADARSVIFGSASTEGFAARVRAALPVADADLLLQALATAHRITGEGVASVIEVAGLLLEQHADWIVVAAVLLGPSAKMGHISPREIESSFGPTVALIVNGICDAAALRTDTEAHHHADCDDLLRAAGTDVRVLVARIALRLVELTTEHADSSTRVALATETRQIMVPLTDRLGLGVLRSKLEDACFRILEPNEYGLVFTAVAPVRSSDDICLDLVRRKVASVIDENGVEATVTARAKSLWSLYSKMRRLDLPIGQIMDRLGLRVIVGSVPDCYRVLGLLHTHFRPVPGTFNDYVGLPKDNGYQSLHTCVYPVHEISAKPIEFQIRTHAMHAEAEYGVAAHWLYKSEADANDECERQRHWLHALALEHEVSTNHEDFIERLRRLVYEQSLVVFLRGGRQVRLSAGANARDLVEKIAHRPALIKDVRINAQPHALETLLHDGDTVEWDEPNSENGQIA
jgi:GTP pyrophosphokinase